MTLYENITLADLQAAQTAGTLKTGVIYRIVSGSTNFTTGGELFEVQAISATQLANTGTGIFQNCDWQNIGDYSDVFGLTGFNPVTGLGMWQTLKGTLPYDTLVGAFAVGETVTGGTSAATGIVVADDGSTLTLRALTAEFQSGEVLTGGTSMATANSTSTVTYTFNPQQGDVVIGWGGANSNYWGHYQKITTANIFVDPVTDAGTNYTFLPRDGSKYGYIEEVDEITYHAEADVLEERTDPRLLCKLQGDLVAFPFGHPSITQINQIGTGGILIIRNPNGAFSNTSFKIANQITINETDGGINDSEIQSSVTINGIITTITSSNIQGYATITNCNIVRRSNINFGSTVQNLGELNGVVIGSNANINGQSQFDFKNGSISENKSLTLINSHDGESLYANSSSMSASFPAAANEAAGVLTIPVNWGYIGIFKNNTTPANPITAFAGEIPSDHQFAFAPTAGHAITFTTTAIALATAGQIVSRLAGATTLILNGDNGDTATFQLLANGFVQLVESVVAL